jgi:hypothetical protein
MRTATLLVGLSTAAVAFTATPAHAAAGLVDGTVQSTGVTCSWTGAATSNVPPNALTIDRTTVSPSCDSSITVTLANNPTVTFNDTPPGTASSPQIDVTVSNIPLIGTCGYRVTNVVLNRQSGRTYTAAGRTANKISGSFLCPGTATIDSVVLTFR